MVQPIVYHLYSVEYWFKIIQDSYGISFISHPPLPVIGGTYRNNTWNPKNLFYHNKKVEQVFFPA